MKQNKPPSGHSRLRRPRSTPPAKVVAPRAEQPNAVLLLLSPPETRGRSPEPSAEPVDARPETSQNTGAR